VGAWVAAALTPLGTSLTFRRLRGNARGLIGMNVHTTSDDHRFMGLALDEAKAAAEAGDVPIGAVLVDGDGEVVARGRNMREQRGDPTAHAEIEALRDGSQFTGWRRERSTLYVTLEPCPMCMGALVNARVSRVVFGAWDRKAGAAETLYRIGRDPRLNHEVVSEGGVREDECKRVLQDFFKQLRERRKNP